MNSILLLFSDTHSLFYHLLFLLAFCISFSFLSSSALAVSRDEHERRGWATRRMRFCSAVPQLPFILQWNFSGKSQLPPGRRLGILSALGNFCWLKSQWRQQSGLLKLHNLLIYIASHLSLLQIQVSFSEEVRSSRLSQWAKKEAPKICCTNGCDLRKRVPWNSLF